jgi:hypothetical protein
VEYEAVVVSLRNREALRVHHELDRFNTLRGGNTGTGGRGNPHSETGRDHSGGNGNQADLAHLSSPVQLATATCGSSIPFDGEEYADHGFDRCDGHHEIVDFSFQRSGLQLMQSGLGGRLWLPEIDHDAVL